MIKQALLNHRYKMKICITCTLLFIFALVSSSCGMKFPDFKSGLFAFNNPDNDYINDDLYEEPTDESLSSKLYEGKDVAVFQGEGEIDLITNTITINDAQLDKDGYTITLDGMKYKSESGKISLSVSIINNGSEVFTVDYDNCVLFQNDMRFSVESSALNRLFSSTAQPGESITSFMEFMSFDYSDFIFIIPAYISGDKDNVFYYSFEMDIN